MDYEQAIATINGFLKANRVRYRIYNNAIQREFGIEAGRIEVRLRRPTPLPRAAVRQQFIAFAEAIRQDEAAVRDRLSAGRIGASDGSTDEPEALLRLANTLGASDDLGAAVGLARLALHRAIAKGPDVLWEVLPGTLFCLHRQGGASDLASAVRRSLLPYLGDHPRLAVPPIVAAAARGQLACVLNEGGATSAAMALFASPDVKALAGTTGPLAWSGPMVIRNEAYCWAWHEGALSRALDATEHAAQRDPSTANAQSVANTLCEIHRFAGDHRSAWEAAQPQYDRVVEHLDAHYDLRLGECTGQVLPRFHHSFGSLFTGVSARLGLGDRAYLAEEAYRDATMLESMLGIDGRGVPRRPMPLGGVAPAPVSGLPPPLASRFQRISNLVVKPAIAEHDIEIVTALAQTLSQAAGR